MANPNQDARLGRLVRTWYRSLTPDGGLWCETPSIDELIQQSHPSATLRYERRDFYEVSTGWQPFTIERGE